MSGNIQFETPENVRISYQLAGPGTRFIAWFVDCILLWLVSLVILFVMIIVGGSMDAVFKETVSSSPGNHEPPKFVLYAAGLYYLAFSLGSFFYFGLCELLWRGQTVGKRQMHIRVVKSDGFSLDPGSIFIRSVFRLVDQIPPLWLVPVLSEKTQRLGDLVAGTVVIADQSSSVVGLREALANRKPADSRFHFDAGALGRARAQDVEAVEKILERWQSLDEQKQAFLLHRLVPPLAARMRVEAPGEPDRLQFLEDFLAAEYRRQYRKLG